MKRDKSDGAMQRLYRMRRNTNTSVAVSQQLNSSFGWTGAMISMCCRCGKAAVSWDWRHLDGGGFVLRSCQDASPALWKRGSEATVEDECPMKTKLHDGDVGGSRLWEFMSSSAIHHLPLNIV